MGLVFGLASSAQAQTSPPTFNPPADNPPANNPPADKPPADNSPAKPPSSPPPSVPVEALPPIAPAPRVEPLPAPEPASAVVTVSAEPSQIGRVPAEDPQADRVVLLPTAYTHPKGTAYFTSYDIVLLQAGYAFTDSTQVTLTALPIPSESFTAVDLSLKTALVRSGLVQMAAIASASGGVGKDIGGVFIGRLGGVAQLCLDSRCDSSFSLSSNLTLAGALVLMANGVGGIWRLGRTVSLLGELATLLPLGTQGGEFHGAALGGGVRFHRVHWGFDVTLIRALDSSSPVVPLLTATYRS